jgi:hypothetical protein
MYFKLVDLLTVELSIKNYTSNKLYILYNRKFTSNVE